MKKWLYGIGIGIVLLLLVIAFFALQPKEVKVARVYGYGSSPGGYSIFTSMGGASSIPCTREQLNILSDDSNTNVSYSVVYERNKWLRNHPHILKILRYERPFPTDQNKHVKSFYYRLTDERLEPINDHGLLFTRLYEKRESYNNLFDVIPQSIVIPSAENIEEARQWVQQHHPEFLRLMDETVVDDAVLDQWKQDGYQQVYDEQSPEGYSLEDIIHIHRDDT